MKIKKKLMIVLVSIALAIGVVGGIATYYQSDLIENNTVN